MIQDDFLTGSPGPTFAGVDIKQRELANQQKNNKSKVRFIEGRAHEQANRAKRSNLIWKGNTEKKHTHNAVVR